MSENPSIKAVSATRHRHEKVFEAFDQVNWVLTSLVVYVHTWAIYSLIRILSGQISWKTLLYHFVLSQVIWLSCAIGPHRLWSHRSYKAKPPLRIFLMIFNTMAAQGSIYMYARWHRLHHKFSDTPGDPHNSTRGFFFAHIGWFLLYDHKKFLKNSQGEIFTEDLEYDKVVMWQHRNYYWLVVLATSVPASVPWLMGWENLLDSTALMNLTIMYLLHLVGVVNSVAHGGWGVKPFDKSIRPARVSFLGPFLQGEEDHNYHHTFPWDYKSSEARSAWNIAMHFIDVLHWTGLAEDLKTASPELVARRAERTGDGSCRKIQ